MFSHSAISRMFLNQQSCLIILVIPVFTLSLGAFFSMEYFLSRKKKKLSKFLEQGSRDNKNTEWHRNYYTEPCPDSFIIQSPLTDISSNYLNNGLQIDWLLSLGSPRGFPHCLVIFMVLTDQTSPSCLIDSHPRRHTETV